MSLPRYININGDDTLVRDTFSMGVLNMNTTALTQYKRLHEQALAKLAEQRRKDQELNTLREEVSELKGLVSQLIEKIKCTE